MGTGAVELRELRVTKPPVKNKSHLLVPFKALFLDNMEGAKCRCSRFHVQPQNPGVLPEAVLLLHFPFSAVGIMTCISCAHEDVKHLFGVPK